MAPLPDDTLLGSPSDPLDLDGELKPDLSFLDSSNLDNSNLDWDAFDFDDEQNRDSLVAVELHEKRKVPDEADDEAEGGAKRQEKNEGGEKTAKKPGRKMLTSEPTTKRKAQNRAAQRAFRERKEKHVKDLESKVEKLTKEHEHDRREKNSLRTQIERLQAELRGHRRRLHAHSTSSISPSALASTSTDQAGNPSQMPPVDFQFDFSTFDTMFGNTLFPSPPLSNDSNDGMPNGATSAQRSPPDPSKARTLQGENGTTRRLGITGSSDMSSYQPPSTMPPFSSYNATDNAHGFASTLAPVATAEDPLGDLFSPGTLAAANAGSAGGYFDNTAPLEPVVQGTGSDMRSHLDHVFQFTGSGPTSDATSPRTSCASYCNITNGSSNNTSPEPLKRSPAIQTKDGDAFGNRVNFSRMTSHPRTMAADSSSTLSRPTGGYAAPGTSTFDPVLFGDYRDGNDTSMRGDNYSGSLFDDAFDPQPLGIASPSNLFGILDSPPPGNAPLGAPNSVANAPTPSQNLMAQVDQTCSGGVDERHDVAPMTFANDGKYISCQKIWTQFKSHPSFQDGTFDVDGLCAELRSKARCSESGMLVEQEHVNETFRKMGGREPSTTCPSAAPAPDTTGSAPSETENGPMLMFELDKWDDALRRFGGGSGQVRSARV